jgi:creatinine amidohydrolase
MTSSRRLAELTMEEAAGALRAGTVLLLPIGSLEAHGPHLPLETDVIIAVETARRAGERLAERGIPTLLLPPLAYAIAECARSFPGTVSVPPESVTAQIGAIARSLAPAGGPLLCLVNAHLEPAHLRALRAAASEAGGSGCRVVYPDQTRRPHVDALGEEFRHGGGHAGGYETSLVLAAGGRVDESVRAGLAPNPVDLATALRSGLADFRAVGGERAYFGDPAAASREEGERLYSLLAGIVADAAAAALDSFPAGR